ncbi:MAG: ATP-binding cassette domain-containing protein [Eubacteriales bacterium]|nr:ATP-binding cassette domain-containing protein [Eubacteriales bacterium]
MRVEARNLGLGYGKQKVLEGLNFSLEAGSWTLIVGENGSGKSSLIKAILGLIPIQTGSLEWQLDGEFPHRATRPPAGIAYLPQISKIQADFPASVDEILRAAERLVKRRSRSERAEAIESVCDRLDISSLRPQAFRSLSGGQQRRVLLARALLVAREFLFLDEAHAGLDRAAQDGLDEELYRIHKEGMGLVLVSHEDPGRFRSVDQVIHLRGGRAILGGEAK